MTTITAAGYIIQDLQGMAIYGAGKTVDEAWAQVVDGVRHFNNSYGDTITADEAYETQFKTYGASQALLDRVDDCGGAISWGRVGGVACTIEEEEAALTA